MSAVGDVSAAAPPPPPPRVSAVQTGGPTGEAGASYWLAATLDPSASGSSSLAPQASPAARATTPQPTEDWRVHPNGAPSGSLAAEFAPPREGSSHHRSISIRADGSAHGGRHYFQVASEGRAAGTADGLAQRGSTHNSAVWVVDGSVKAGTAPASAQQPRPDSGASGCRCCGCTCSGGVGSGGGGGGSGSGVGRSSGRQRGQGQKGGPFAGATVLIEEANDQKLFDWGTYWSSLPKKLKGGLDTRLPVPSWRNLFWSCLGAFLGIMAVCSLNQFASPEIDIAFLVGSFGASAVLVFAVLESKMSQPRNFLGGQVLSALVGVTTRVVIQQPWIAGPVGMSLALLLMQLTSTTHPPGGATALIASTLTTLPRWHGYSFIVTVLVGSLVMQAIALIINNLDPRRRYPTFWW